MQAFGVAACYYHGRQMRSSPSRIAKHAVHTYRGCCRPTFRRTGLHKSYSLITCPYSSSWKSSGLTEMADLWVLLLWLVASFSTPAARRPKPSARLVLSLCPRGCTVCVFVGRKLSLPQRSPRHLLFHPRQWDVVSRSLTPEYEAFLASKPRHTPVSWFLAPWVVRMMIILKKTRGAYRCRTVVRYILVWCIPFLGSSPPPPPRRPPSSPIVRASVETERETQRPNRRRLHFGHSRYLYGVFLYRVRVASNRHEKKTFKGVVKFLESRLT